MRSTPTATTLDTEVLVIGSGAGGATTAAKLAAAGRVVTVVEEGPWVEQDAVRPFSLEQMDRQYRAGGITVALGLPSQHLEQCVEVEGPQDLVLRIPRARGARLKPAELRHGPPRDVLQSCPASVAECLGQLRHELVAARRLVALVSFRHGVGSASCTEVQIEQRVERLHMTLILDHRRREGRAGQR